MAIANYEGYFEPDDDDNLINDAIDPQWELIQKKTFTGWCNAHLRQVNESIEAIDVDFRNGLKLMRLLEVISGERLTRPEKGKMRFHKIGNVNKSLSFIEGKGVKLVSIGAEEIVDGNVKMTLGMIWTIILRFSIQDIQMEDSSAKAGLLLWCQRQTAGYDNVKIKDFHNSFKDGLAFCALIHKFRPDLIEYNTLHSKNAIDNLKLGFDVAATHLDIPKILDPEDIANSVRPDERSIMAYVSFYYHKFAGENKASMAANRISTVIKMNQDTTRLINEYETLSSDLLEWIQMKSKHFSSREPPLNVSSVENLQGNLRSYHRKEKPEKLHDKAVLETKYSTIQTKLRLSKRPPYVPSSEKYISNVCAQWDELDTKSQEYGQWLLDELQRLRRVDCIIRKFETRCSTHEAWSKGKPEMLSDTNYRIGTLSELQALMRRHEAFQSELSGNQDRVDRICDLVKELEKLNYHDMDSINKRHSAVTSKSTEIQTLSNAREKDFIHLLPVLENIDELQLDFAKRAAPFRNWMEQTEEDLRDTPVVHTKVEVQRYLTSHAAFEETLDGTEHEMNEISNCANKVLQLAEQNQLTDVLENPYTTIKPEDLTQIWNLIKDLCEKRSENLRVEEERQAKNDKLCETFAQKAKEFDKWLQEQKATITKITMEDSGSLESLRDALKNLELDIQQRKMMLNELEHCDQALENAYVFENPYTTLSMVALRVVWDQLSMSLHVSVNAIENQMLLRDSRGLRAEQMNELKQCFKHFDKNQSSALDPAEFKACLVSLGHSFGDDLKSGSVVEKSDFDRIMRQIDPNNTGYVTFDAFLNFMTRETADDDTPEQIIQSFKALSGDKGYVTAADIRRLLPPSDAEYCIANMKPMMGSMGDSGALNYEQFATEIYRSN